MQQQSKGSKQQQPKATAGKQIVPKDRSQPNQRTGQLPRGIQNSYDPISFKPVALQPFASYDRPHDFNAAGGLDHLKVLKISYADYSQRPARRQIEEVRRGNMQAPEGCNEYNIWYGKWIGEQFKEPKELVAAATRCSVRRDAGKTKAEYRFGEAAFYCLFFARGCCSQGSECTYLHRIPGAEDDKRLDMLHDIFGRERHASDRDDMRGVGNFNRNNRTLYVGGLKVLLGAETTHRAILRHFSEWGEIEQLRLIPSKSIAFVRYKFRVCAEFALEAMHCQTMDLDELLNIRWAFEDPNPKAEAIERQHLQEQLVEAMEERGINLANAAYEYPPDYHAVTEGDDGPDDDDDGQGWPKRRRVISADYPNTDAQYTPAYAYLAHTVAPPPPSPAPAPAAGAEVGARVMTKEAAEREAARERAVEARRTAAATQDRLASVLNMVDQVAARESGTDSGEMLDPAAAAAAAAEAAAAADAAEAQAEQAAAAVVVAAAAAAAARAPRPLGFEDWVECVDAQGRTYYHSAFRNTTTWDRPAPSGWDVAHAQAVAAAEAAAAAATAAAARPPTWDPAWVAQYARYYGLTFQQARDWLVKGVSPSPGFTGQAPAAAASASAAQDADSVGAADGVAGEETADQSQEGGGEAEEENEVLDGGRGGEEAHEEGGVCGQESAEAPAAESAQAPAETAMPSPEASAATSKHAEAAEQGKAKGKAGGKGKGKGGKGSA